MVTFSTNKTFFYWIMFIFLQDISNSGKVGRGAERKLYDRAFEPAWVLVNFPMRLIFRSKERTSFRWMKGTYLKANFRLWLESGWRHALVGAELGKVLLTVCQKLHFLFLMQYGITVFGAICFYPSCSCYKDGVTVLDAILFLSFLFLLQRWCYCLGRHFVSTLLVPAAKMALLSWTPF